jgi:Mor family transcriptional regulator
MPPVTNPEFLDEFASVSVTVLEQAMPELGESVRMRLAERLVSAFIREWGGCALYVPKADHLARHRRNRAIVRDFDHTLAGANDLAKKHGLSLQAIYRIVKATQPQPGNPAHP